MTDTHQSGMPKRLILAGMEVSIEDVLTSESRDSSFYLITGVAPSSTLLIRLFNQIQHGLVNLKRRTVLKLN